jgi:hypothetical protein
MSKNKLLIAISAGVFAVTAAGGAFAQTSSGNSSAGMSADSNAMGNDTTSSTQSGTMSKHKMHKHTAHPSAGKKTPDATTGNNPAAENGQGK